MKKFYKFFSAICTILVVCCLVTALYAFIQYRGMSGNDGNNTMTLAVESVKALSAWDPQEMEKRQHPLFAEAVKKSGLPLEDYFKMYRKLGKLNSEPACTLVNFKSNVGLPTYTVADFNCTANYDTGPATIFIELLNDKDSHGAFLITTYKVDSPYFIKLLAQ